MEIKNCFTGLFNSRSSFIFQQHKGPETGGERVEKGAEGGKGELEQKMADLGQKLDEAFGVYERAVTKKREGRADEAAVQRAWEFTKTWARVAYKEAGLDPQKADAILSSIRGTGGTQEYKTDLLVTAQNQFARQEAGKKRFLEAARALPPLPAKESGPERGNNSYPGIAAKAQKYIDKGNYQKLGEYAQSLGLSTVEIGVITSNAIPTEDRATALAWTVIKNRDGKAVADTAKQTYIASQKGEGQIASAQ